MNRRHNGNFKALIEIADHENKLDLLVQWTLSEFVLFYTRFNEITESAKTAFEKKDYRNSLEISRKRLALYSDSMYQLGENLSEACPEASQDQELWDIIEDKYRQLVISRYEGDLALAYFHSVRRSIFRGVWSPVAYSFGIPNQTKKDYSSLRATETPIFFTSSTKCNPIYNIILQRKMGILYFSKTKR